MIRWMTLVLVLAVVPALPADEARMDETAETQPAELSPARVKLETTLGDIVLELNAERAPISVQNFLKYVEDGFYEGTVFHRVISGFMIQGGGFTSEMVQKTEGLRPPIKNEWKNGLKNRRGTVAMARTRKADSATAQFFINVVDNGSLDRPRDGAAYAVFGKVVEGMDVVDKIRHTKVIRHPKYASQDPVTPEEPVVIKSAELIGKYDRTKLDARIAALELAEKEAKVKAEAARRKELQDVIARIEQETGKKFEKTASGLMYVILKEGDGPSPALTDTIEAHYTLTLVNGKKIQSSRDTGAPLVYPLDKLIPGWKEGVSMMKVGGQRKMIIPPELAYGKESPPGSGIPAGATLVFEVELLSIKPPQNP